MDRGAILRRCAFAVAVLTASTALALTTAGGAHAAPAPFTTGAKAPAASCPGRKVRTLAFATGTVQVYRSGGHVCALTLPKHAGAARIMSVSVQARGNRPVTDRGRYVLRAGPVTVHAGHRCVRLKGSVGSSSVSSGWLLC